MSYENMYVPFITSYANSNPANVGGRILLVNTLQSPNQLNRRRPNAYNGNSFSPKIATL